MKRRPSPALVVLVAAAVAQQWPASVGAAERDPAASSFRPFARAHIDAGYWDGPAASDRESTLRRARIGARGRLGEAWRYRTEIDVRDWELRPVDAWLQWRPGRDTRFTFGNQQVPMGLHAFDGSERRLFLEPGLPAALTSGYRTGVLWQQRLAGRSTVAGGVFGERLSRFDDVDDTVAGGRGVNVRATRAWQGERLLLHAGVALERRWPGDNTLRIRARPETRLGNIRVVDTRRIADARHATTAAAEVAALGRRLAVTAEHIGSTVRRDGHAAAHFHGWQATAVWTFAADAWDYDRRRGRIVADLPAGRWSLGLRLSELDLGSGGIDGGRAFAATVAASYRLTAWLRYTVEAGRSHGRDRNGDPFSQRRVQFRLLASLR